MADSNPVLPSEEITQNVNAFRLQKINDIRKKNSGERNE